MPEAAVIQHIPHCGLGFFQRLGHDHALAGRQAIGLDHDGSAVLAQVIQRRSSLGEFSIGGRGDAVALHEGLGKRLARFELGAGRRWTKTLEPRIAEPVNNAGRQRCLRADDRECHGFAICQGQQAIDVLCGHRHVLAQRFNRRPGIAGCHQHATHLG